MSNDVEITVSSKNETAAGFAAANAGSEAAAKKFKSDQEDMAKASDNFEQIFKKNLQDGETASQSLQRVVDNTRAEVEKLRSSFAETGSSSDFMGLKKMEADLATAESYLQDMVGKAPKQGKEISTGLSTGMYEGIPLIGGFIQAITNKLVSLVSDAGKVGEKAGVGLAEGMTSAASAGAQDLPQLFTPEGAIGAAIVTVIVGGLAAVIGGAIGTALTLGVGIGFIGIGALILKNNAQVLSSFTQLKTQVGSVLSTAAQPLVAPFQKAMATIDAMFVKIGPDLERVFAAVAPAIDPIVNGITGFISALVPELVGVGHAFASVFADPGVQAQLHLLEAAFLNIFSEVASHGQDVADFFAILVGAVTAVVVTVDLLVRAWDLLVEAWRGSPLGMIADGVTHLAGAISGASGNAEGLSTSGLGAAVAVSALNASVKDAAETSNEFGSNLDQLSSQLSKTDVTAQTLAGELADKLLGTIMDNDLAVLHFDESLTNLAKTLHSNRDALNIHTAAGQADREAILASVEANIKQYDALIASGSSAANAAKQYDLNTAALEKQLRNAGLTTAQINDLIGAYRGIPKNAAIDIATGQLTNAILDLDSLLTKLGQTQGWWPVTVDVKVNGEAQLNKVYDQLTGGGGPGRTVPSSSSTSSSAPKGMGHPGKASGGIASGLNVLAEQGRELLGNLAPGTMVHSNPDTERILGGSQSQGGGSAKFEWIFGSGSDTALGTLVQKLVRTGQIQLRVNGQPVTV